MNSLKYDFIKNLIIKSKKNDRIPVAEIFTETLSNGIESTRIVNSVLIETSLIEQIKPDQINCNCDVIVNPDYDEEDALVPHASFHLSDYDGLIESEPLVLCWEQANNYVLQPDQGFLMTYGLIPRLIEKSNRVFWDDLSKPKHNIVEVLPVSIYNANFTNKAEVLIDKNYLQDFSSLRKKSIVKIFILEQFAPIDSEISSLLGSDDYYHEVTTTCCLVIKKNPAWEDKVFIEITGYEVICSPGTVPISYNKRKKAGHQWRGIEGVVDYNRACRSGELAWDYVYVSDEVLAEYEGNDNYDINPERGSVSYKGEWVVGHCQRVGKNAIRLEIKKLYEGNHNEVIEHWNKYSIDPVEELGEENIVKKAKKIVWQLVDLGIYFCDLSERLGLELSIEKIIGLDKRKLEYYGWYNNDSIKPITYHLKSNLKQSEFLSRCTNLYKVVGENLQEKALRSMMKKLNIPDEVKNGEKSDKKKSLKMLDDILDYISISHISGLNLFSDSDEINNRLKNGSQNIVTELFALNDLRQLDSHKSEKSFNDKFSLALDKFGLDANLFASGNYNEACIVVYDKIYITLKRACDLLNQKS